MKKFQFYCVYSQWVIWSEVQKKQMSEKRLERSNNTQEIRKKQVKHN